MSYIPLSKQWAKIKEKLESEGALNKQYDSDLDSVIEKSAGIKKNKISSGESLTIKSGETMCAILTHDDEFIIEDGAEFIIEDGGRFVLFSL